MSNRHFASAVLAVALLAGCAGAQKQSTVAETTKPEAAKSLISREVLFGNPDKAGPQISPDGKWLSWIAPVNGVLNVWVAPADDLEKAKAITKDDKRGVRRYFWAFTNRHVLYMQDKGGDENWRVYSVDVETGAEKDLTPFENVAARIQHVSPKFPKEILVGLNKREPRFHDVHRVDITTGKMTMVQQNDRFAGFLTNDDYQVRLAVEMTKDGGSEHFKPGKKKGSWVSFLKVPMEDTMGTNPIGFDKTGNRLYMTDSRGRDTAALVAVDVATGKVEVLAQHAKADAGEIVMHPTEKTIQAAGFTWLRDEWKVLDESVKADFEALKKLADGDFSVGAQTLKNDKWIVAYTFDDAPVKYFLWDRTAKKEQFLFTNRTDLEGVRLASMHPSVIKAADGLELVSYLTLPTVSDPDGDGKPGAPVPMVLLVHGGPWGRDSWGLNGMHQWLADRGYAVLSVNFRGSTGFGKNFVNAGNLQWAGTMHQDLLDAVKWAESNGIAVPQKTCIMGGSYGGYATLVGLTFTPDVFACGVDIVGPSNLVTLLETIPPYWAPMMELFATRVGDPRTEEGKKLLMEKSPITKVDAIKKPLLIGQGANDPRVKQAESDQIVTAMKEKQIPVIYALFPDEGHGFARPENRLAFFAVAEHFLAKNLGGRAEPIGDDLKGSSIQVPEGAAQIEGLPAALKQVQPAGAASAGSGSGH